MDDSKKRLAVITIVLFIITTGVWLLGSPDWQIEVLPVTFRVTLFFAILLLAFDDVKSLRQRLKGPVGILIGCGLLLAVLYKPSAKAILPILIGSIAVIGVLGFIRRQFTGNSPSNR